MSNVSILSQSEKESNSKHVILFPMLVETFLNSSRERCCALKKNNSNMTTQAPNYSQRRVTANPLQGIK